MEHSISQNEEEITVAAFERWLRTARPGQRFVYHRGLLASDRESTTLVPSLGAYVHVYYEPVHTIGQIAWHAYQHGYVELAQRRLGPERYEYIAFKRRAERKRQ